MRFSLIGFFRVSAILVLTACTGGSFSVAAEENSLGQEIQTFSAWQDIKTIAWSPDQTRIAFLASREGISGYNTPAGKLGVYDLAKGHMLWPTESQATNDSRQKIRGIFGTIAFDPSGQFIISSATLQLPELQDATTDEVLAHSRTTVFSLIPADTGEPLRPIKDETIDDTPYKDPNNKLIPRINAIGVSPDGTIVATSMGGSGTIALYDSTTWSLKQHLGPWLHSLNGRDHAISFNELLLDNKHGLIIGFAPQGEASVWDINTNTNISLTKPHVADGKWIPTGGDATAYALNPMTGDYITGATDYGPVEKRISERMKGVPDNSWTRALNDREFNEDKLINAWNPRTGEKTITYPTIPGYGGVNALAVSPDGRYVAAAQGSGLLDIHILLWDAATAKLLATANYNKNHWAHAVAFSPDSKRLAYSIDSTVHIVEIGPSASDHPGDHP